MKRLAVAAGILLLLLVLSICSGLALSDLTGQCITQLKNAQEMATQNDWESAKSITCSAYQIWNDHKFALHTLLRHAEADEILVSFRCVNQYLELEEMDQYAAANVTLITQLELLTETERVSPENVL
jgi:hypothetical protein